MAAQPDLSPGEGKRPHGAQSLHWLLVGVMLLQVGGFAFLWMKISATPPAATTFKLDPATTLAAVKPPDQPLMRESIRSLLKEELQPYVEQLQQKTSSRPPAGAAGNAVAARPHTPANPQAGQQSLAIVDRALATGVWTDADNNALLKLTPHLAETQRIELLEKIFGAINRQQLKATGSLPSL